MKVSRETSITKAAAAKCVFSNEVIGALLGGHVFSHLTEDALTLLLIAINGALCGPSLVAFNSREVADSIYGLLYNDDDFLFYPPIEKTVSVKGFENESLRYRQETLISLAVGSSRSMCLSTSTTSTVKDIPSDPMLSLSKIDLIPGEKLGRDRLIGLLSSWGYEKCDFVFDPNSFSVRGDVIDLFPSHFQFPLRVLFDFSLVSSLCFFNVVDQKKTKEIDRISVRHFNNDPMNENKKSLVDSFSWRGFYFVDGDLDSLSISIDNLSNDQLSLDCFSHSLSEKSGVLRESLLSSSVSKYGPGRVFLFEGQNEVYSEYVNVSGYLSTGFYSDILGVCCISGATNVVKGRWNNQKEKDELISKDSLSSIAPGDYLVHSIHGIGKYEGLSIVGPADNEKECLSIVYKNNGLLHVPLEKLGCVHRYVSNNKNPTMHELGKKRWGQDIKKTKDAVSVVSNKLLALYSNKKTPRGFSYAKKDDLISALEDSFPFIETPDQQTAIKDVFNDLDKKYPMDRLICGDVGFGKTEVALRAIMRTAVSGKQTMLLCPTTILSDQHYITCKERLSPLGLKTVLLSRFKTKKEQGAILDKLANRKAELVVGTHRLLSEDVVIPELSLLIIDEEHRFGVKHKEKIRQIRSGLDLLSLSATPIPRTLQHSLVGVRDISKIRTPPKTRKPILTRVKYFNWDLIKKTIEEELFRGGQVYYVHNNILSLQHHTNKIREFFPEKKVLEIHGKMESRTLEKRILSFFSGNIDILVCTTIIESGLDVTNANCIVINNAQKLGLSQLYQIRGRVGRGHRRGECLLLIPKKDLDGRAYRRLKTIEQHTSLGSGYDIALKDLAIRGAGSLFGHKQSGHISDVGFEMYCQLLKESVDFVFGREENIRYPSVNFSGNALISSDYIKSPSIRLGFYEKISKSNSHEEIKDIKKEIFNRFGRLPVETVSLLKIADVRMSYRNTFVSHLSFGDGIFSIELMDPKKGAKKTRKIIESLITFEDNNITDRRIKKTKKDKIIIEYTLSSLSSGLSLGDSFSKLFSDNSFG